LTFIPIPLIWNTSESERTVEREFDWSAFNGSHEYRSRRWDGYDRNIYESHWFSVYICDLIFDKFLGCTITSYGISKRKKVGIDFIGE